MNENVNYCRRCVLNSAMPGVTVDGESGLCQFCRENSVIPPEEQIQAQHSMGDLLRLTRGGGSFDVVYALSGGKDSSYGLYRIKKEYPDLRIRAILFDNGFISSQAIENARTICDVAGAEFYRLTVDQDLLNEAFRNAAMCSDVYPDAAKLRASDICNTCISIVKQKLMEEAIVSGAPHIMFAFTPGQTQSPVIRLSPAFMRWSRNLFEGQLRRMGIADENEVFMLKKGAIEQGETDGARYMLHPLLLWDYDERNILRVLGDIGWKAPNLRDKNSTNCLLNSFTIFNHIQKYGFHPYACEIAGLVRCGTMSREMGFEKLNAGVSKPLVRDVGERLGLSPEYYT
jgi:tRNA(Ile)-lysidine synthase TilS/MesJ